MNWMIKCFIQTILSTVPFGKDLNYIGQRHILKILPANNDEFQRKVGDAKKHFDTYTKYTMMPLKESTFYEFGVGQDMIIPLTFYSLGVRRQIVTDIRKIAKEPLILNSMHRLNIVNQTLKDCGITYIAPLDSRFTGFEASSVDFVTSSSVLEHIERSNLQHILKNSAEKSLFKPFFFAPAMPGFSKIGLIHF